MTRDGDRASLHTLVEAYARHADRREFAALAELFVSDGVLAIHHGDPDATPPVRVRNGRAEILAAMEGLRTYTVTHHMLGQHSVWFDSSDPRGATGETYCMASHIRDDGATRTNRMMAIRYQDRFVTDGKDWRFAERRLVVDWTDDRPIQ